MARRGWRGARPCPRRRAGTRRRKRPPVKYTLMGSTGAQVSRLCLGCMGFGGMADWTLSEADSLPIIRKAVECGINFFDTADIYSSGQSEEILGRALKTLAVRRDETVVATKLFYAADSSEEHTSELQSLMRL